MSAEYTEITEKLLKASRERLAKIITSLYYNNPNLSRQFEIIFATLEDDPKKIAAVIKKEITSLKRSSRFVDYRESSELATRLDTLRESIMRDLLPQSANEAQKLMLAFLELDEVTLERVDDSGGWVGDSFRYACEDFGKILALGDSSVEERAKLVLQKHQKNDYSVFDRIITCCKDALGIEGLNWLKAKLQELYPAAKEGFHGQWSIIFGLKEIADCQDDIEEYIEACKLEDKIQAHEYIEIVKRLIKQGRGQNALEWLAKSNIDSDDRRFYDDYRRQRIDALELVGEHAKFQQECTAWFEETLSNTLYKRIIAKSDAEFKSSFKKRALDLALSYREIYSALHFLQEVEEYKLLGKLVKERVKDINGDFYYSLRPISDALKESDALAATLLYRKMAEAVLAKAKSKYYNYVTKDLVSCYQLSNKVEDWGEFVPHNEYISELLEEHKKKRSFLDNYKEGMAKYLAKLVSTQKKRNAAKER